MRPTLGSRKRALVRQLLTDTLQNFQEAATLHAPATPHHLSPTRVARPSRPHHPRCRLLLAALKLSVGYPVHSKTKGLRDEHLARVPFQSRFVC